MVTKSITIERNYRVSNDDPYARTRLVHNIDLEEGETKQDATIRGIKELDEIFCIAYPHVAPHLNFHVVRQIDKEERNLIEVGKIRQQDIEDRLKDFDNRSYQNHTVLPTPPEKIEQKPTEETNIPKIGTVERTIHEIQHCTTFTQLKEFELMASMNKKVKGYYDEKMSTEPEHVSIQRAGTPGHYSYNIAAGEEKSSTVNEDL